MLDQKTKATDVCKSSYHQCCVVEATGYIPTIVHWLRVVKPYERRSQALADSAVSFEGGTSPAGEVPQIIENLTEVDIRDVEEECVFLNRFKLGINRFWMRKHPSSGIFWNSKENC